MGDEFVIYRPEKTTGRLEGLYYQDPTSSWRPSVSYKHNISEIRSQLTPAENFRYTLQTSGKLIRIIQRLEIRWNRNFSAFMKASVRIQSLHRGIVSRKYYRSVKEQLMIDMMRRKVKLTASSYFIDKKYENAIDEINRYFSSTVELISIKMKSQYMLKLHLDCIASTEQIIELDTLYEEAYYIQGCCWIILNENDKAYTILKQAAIQFEQPERNTLKLCAYIALRIQPPRYMEAVDSFTAIVKTNSHDFEAIVERACCYFCLQEWTLGIKDLSFVLVFIPTHTKALLLRARGYACVRNWELARGDYNMVLFHHPESKEAQQGLADVEDKVIVLPMLGDDLIENESY